jgi:O-antigen biosynthesis protein
LATPWQLGTRFGMVEDQILSAGSRSHPRRHILPVDGDEVALIRARVVDLTAELNRAQAAERATAAERDALRSSFSWRAMGPFRRITRALRRLRRSGREQLTAPMPPAPDLPPGTDYERWLRDYHILSEVDRGAIIAHIQRLAELPQISIIIPVDQEAEHLMPVTLSSIEAQLYTRWEICVVGEASFLDRAKSWLPVGESRIRYASQVGNGIGAVMATAARQVSSPFVTLMVPGDSLSEEALYEVAFALNERPDTDLVYTDEDCIDKAGRRFAPAFKPAWSIDLLLGQNLIGRLAVYRRSLLENAPQTGGAGEHDLALAVAAVSHASRIRHIPAVLYHRLAQATDVQPLFDRTQPPAWTEARKAAVESYIASVAPAEAVEIAVWSGKLQRLQVRWPLPEAPPRVSLIVPTRDNPTLLARCAAGLLHRTNYPDVELIIVDNDSRQAGTLELLSRLNEDRRVRVLPYPKAFNYAAINNMAAGEASGEVIVLINDDIEVIEPDWLREMVANAWRPDVGAVGAKLSYGDGRIQHAGVILGVGEHTGRGGIAGHFGHGDEGDEPGYLDQYALAREVSAVTAACMALRREVFTAVGGFDAEHLPVAYNDVDLCLRIREQGLRIIWTPFAALFHLES